jgi:phosphoribosyl 1,2-cyclic phosphate phosphodiesterase
LALKLTVLGCGTSSGVPRIGDDWGACDPANPHNRRTRGSILIESETTRILVDTSPDMRQQLLAADVIDIDAIIWTHDHADHCHGIDDVRQLAHHKRGAVPGFARAETLAMLRRRFAYAFDGREGYAPIIAAHPLLDICQIGDIAISTVDQPHGAIYSTGLRFDHDGHSIGYATDFHEVTPEMASLFAELDVWVVDALRENPHPTHPHLALTLAAISEARTSLAVLTHMDHSLDHGALSASLPTSVIPGHDGLVISTDEVKR